MKSVQLAATANDPWYQDKIEDSVRDLVFFLRNQGINTECSCGHKQYVQCQYAPDGEIQRLHKLLYQFFAEGKNINYEIIVNIRVQDGHLFSTLEVRF